MTLEELLREKERLEAYLQRVNVRCGARDRAEGKMYRVEREIAKKGAQSA